MKNYPFIRYSLIFICGILINKIFTISSNYLVLPLIFFFLISILSYFYKQRKILGVISVISFYLFFFVLGNYLYTTRTESKSFLPQEIKTIENRININFFHSGNFCSSNWLSIKPFPY